MRSKLLGYRGTLKQPVCKSMGLHVYTCGQFSVFNASKDSCGDRESAHVWYHEVLVWIAFTPFLIWHPSAVGWLESKPLSNIIFAFFGIVISKIKEWMLRNNLLRFSCPVGYIEIKIVHVWTYCFFLCIFTWQCLSLPCLKVVKISTQT